MFVSHNYSEKCQQAKDSHTHARTDTDGDYHFFLSFFFHFFFFFFFFIFFSFLSFFFAVPSTVPTSEALLPRRSSRHPSPPATPRAHSASRPRPQRSTGSDVRSLVGCHPKETLHCCSVTSVVFSSACSDSTYAGHHLLCPLLTTMLAKSRSQTE